MNWGKIAVSALILAALGTGGGMWYAQEYGFYSRIETGSPGATVALTTASGVQPLAITDFEGIDAASSPLRWRGCFRLDDPLPADAVPFEGATPLIGPSWFSCYDANRIGEDLEQSVAHAVLSQDEIHPDVDRVLAVYPDGRAYGWHQYNDKTPERGVMD